MSDPVTERSLMLFAQSHEAEQKFQYFMTGLTGTLCAFVAERYQPDRLGWNASTIELVAIILLVASVVSGLRYIELGIACKKQNLGYIRAGEKLGKLVKQAQREAPAINLANGVTITPEDIPGMISAQTSLRDIARKELEKLQPACVRVYNRRNGLLLAGFVVYLLAKVSHPYFVPNS